MKHKLSDAQMKEPKKAVIGKTPDQLKFDFPPWSSKAIREYVRRAYGMSISRRTARRYMQKMGFTCQYPVKAAREQNKGARPFPGRGLACPLRKRSALGRQKPRKRTSWHTCRRGRTSRKSVRRLFHKKEVRYAAH